MKHRRGVNDNLNYAASGSICGIILSNLGRSRLSLKRLGTCKSKQQIAEPKVDHCCLRFPRAARLCCSPQNTLLFPVTLNVLRPIILRFGTDFVGGAILGAGLSAANGVVTNIRASYVASEIERKEDIPVKTLRMMLPRWFPGAELPYSPEDEFAELRTIVLDEELQKLRLAIASHNAIEDQKLRDARYQEIVSSSAIVPKDNDDKHDENNGDDGRLQR